MVRVFLADRVLRCRPAPMRVTDLVSDCPSCYEDIGVKRWKQPIGTADVNKLLTAVSVLVERQGQRSLNRCSGKDFQHEVLVPATAAAFHDEAIAAGVLLQK